MKVITNGKWNDIFCPKANWKNLILEYGNPKWEIEALIEELTQIKNHSGTQLLIKFKRKLRKYFDIFQTKDVA